MCSINSGKTKCVNTFSSYECQCGSGFIESKDQQGNLTCLNINECAATRLGDLGAGMLLRALRLQGYLWRP